jgi:hypothetical protein
MCDYRLMDSEVHEAGEQATDDADVNRGWRWVALRGVCSWVGNQKYNLSWILGMLVMSSIKLLLTSAA